MSEFLTHDGRYLFVEQEDKNAVVYDTISGKYVPVFDRWSYEASIQGQIPTAPTNPEPIRPPEISVSAGTPVLIARNVNPIGMSYWRNINNHRGQPDMKVVLAADDRLMILTVSKGNLDVVNIEPINVHHTGEGVYFSYRHPDMLYVPQGNTLWRYNISTRQREAAWIVGQNNLWQCHTSADDAVHSATIKDSNYNPIFWGVYCNDIGEKLYDIRGKVDECQVDKSGRFLIIKEDDDNRIIDIYSNNNDGIVITDAQGAVGHSDVGYGYVVGEDNQIGAAVSWTLPPVSKSIVYGPDVWNMGYVSVQNDMCLLSLPDHRLVLVRGGVVSHICDAPTENQPDATDDEKYKNRVKANLCPLGEFAAWTARVNGEMNAYIVRI